MAHSQHHVILMLILLASVSGQDQDAQASAGLLCISECVTCPVICSPPPSPLQETAQPPPDSPPPPKCPSLLAPPPRFIYSFGGILPPPMVYYGVFPAPPIEKKRPKGYEYPYPYYAYYSGVSRCLSLSQPVAIFVLHMFMLFIANLMWN